MATTLLPLAGDFKNKDILSIDQFSTQDLEILFTHVPQMKDIVVNATPSDILKGMLVTLLFYEPSSRTFGSFGAAVKRLGGQTLDILNPESFSSVSKGETLEDTMRVFEAYSNAIVLRHPIAGTAEIAATAAENIPVINAGDGIGEHPTQALLDLYTIYEKFDKLQGLTGVMAGDMLNGRTVHSLLRAFALYPNNTLYLLAPEELKLKKEDMVEFTKRGVKIVEISSEQDIPNNAHFWYWTRVQKERFASQVAYEKVKNTFVLSNAILQEKGNKDLILMHPLPRVGEILTQVDSDPRALYLRNEIRNGLYVRMALLGLVLGKIK